MTNEQILKKAISKAVKNGWNYKPYWHLGITGLAWGDIARNESQHIHIIFSHDFAKAFFGKKKLESWEVDDDAVGRYDKGCHECGTGKMMKVPIWQYHLQQMVLDKDPIKYLEKFL